MLTEGVIIALIALFSGVAGTFVTNYAMRPKLKADAYKSASEGFAASSEALLERIEQQDEKIREQDEKIKLQDEIIREQAKTIERQAGHIRELETKLNKAGLAMR